LEISFLHSTFVQAIRDYEIQNIKDIPAAVHDLYAYRYTSNHLLVAG